MAKGREEVIVVGAGNVARALVLLLPRAGFKVSEIVTRRSSKRRTAVAAAQAQGTKHVTLDRATFTANVVWLAVSDAAIRPCAGQMAKRGDWRNKVVLHSSGALTSDELDPLRRCGARVASVHPMMTFVPGKTPSLDGVAWSVEGDSKAVKAATAIVKALGGRAFKIEKKNKPLYHAFGAFLSPLLVVHMDRAAELAVEAGIPRKGIPRFMAPIVRQTLENLYANLDKKGGSGKAFSGPLVRGDVGTIERHLKALRASGVGKLYRVLVESAIESGLPVKNRDAIRRSLRSRP